MGIRVDHHCQYLLSASLNYGRVKLSVMCVLLCLQLWATITSLMLQGTLKPHAHLLVLLLRLAVTSLSQRFYTGHLIPGLVSTPGVHTHTCLIQSSSRSSLTLFHGCFLSRTRIRACPPPLISCRPHAPPPVRTLTDSHVIDAWVYMPPETFCPYSLLSGTSTGPTN